MMAKLDEFQFQGFQVPEHIREGLDAYLRDHVEPGSALRAILENDLKKACEQADDNVLWSLPVIVAYLYNEAPAHAWGSPDKVATWLGER